MILFMINFLKYILSRKISFILFIFYCFFINTIAGETIDKTEWEKITKGISYSETYKEQNVDLDDKLSQIPSVDLSAFRILIWIIIFALLLVLLYILLRNVLGNTDFSFKKKTYITFENFEDHVDEADLNLLLKKALDEKMYFIALRIQYLMVLQNLNENKLITWKKDKTNGNYLSEMFGNNFYDEFANLTHIFEKVWYGDIKITQTDYELLSVPYILFNQKIKGNETR